MHYVRINRRSDIEGSIKSDWAGLEPVVFGFCFCKFQTRNINVIWEVAKTHERLLKPTQDHQNVLKVTMQFETSHFHVI